MQLKINLFKSTFSDFMSPQRKYLASNANLFIENMQIKQIKTSGFM